MRLRRRFSSFRTPSISAVFLMTSTGIALPAAVQAQDTAPATEPPADNAVELETYTVTGQGLTRASNSITQEELEYQASGVIPQTLLNSLPGVNVQLSDPFGLYEFGTSVRIRGFTSEQLALTLDGVPLEETPDTRDSTPPNRYVDTENLSEINVAQGSGDVTAPSFHALGGSIRYYTSDPLGEWRIIGSETLGSDEMNRTFARLDTPELWTGGPTMLVSGSRTSAVQWQNKHASMRNEHFETKIKQAFDTGSLTLAYLYGNRDDHDISSYGLGYEGNGDFILSHYLTGNPETDAYYYDEWTNGRTDQLTYLNGSFSLTPSLKLDFVPYYEHKDGYGYAGIAPSDAEALYGDSVADPAEGGSGTPGRTDNEPYDAETGNITRRKETMGGDRLGTTLGLTYTLGRHELQLGGWYQHYDFKQIRPLWNVDEEGNWETDGPPIIIYYDRDFSTEVEQYYLKDRFTWTPSFAVELGTKGLHVDRSADGYLNTADYNASETREVSKKDSDYFQPQVGVVWSATDYEEVFANYAENFSALPRLALVASSFNSDLKPETSTNVDLGLRSTRGELTGSVSLYWIDYKDRVLSLTSGDPARVGEDTYENVGDIETYGAEFAAYWTHRKQFKLGGSLTLNSSEFQDNYTTADGVVEAKGEDVPDTPDVMVDLSGTYYIRQFFIGADAKYTGERSASTIGNVKVDDYTVVNLSAGFNGRKGGILEHATIQLNVYNVLDEDYYGVIVPGESTADVNEGAPRSVYLTVRADI